MCSYWSISFAVIVVFGFILEINGDEQWWRPTRFGNSENINIQRGRRGNDHTGGTQDTYSWNNNQWTNEAQGWGRVVAPSKDTNRSDDSNRTNQMNRIDYVWYDDNADDYDDDDDDNDDYDYDGDYDDRYDDRYDDDWENTMWGNQRRVASNNDRRRGNGAWNVIRWGNDMYGSDDLWD